MDTKFRSHKFGNVDARPIIRYIHHNARWYHSKSLPMAITIRGIIRGLDKRCPRQSTDLVPVYCGRQFALTRLTGFEYYVNDGKWASRAVRVPLGLACWETASIDMVRAQRRDLGTKSVSHLCLAASVRTITRVGCQSPVGSGAAVYSKTPAPWHITSLLILFWWLRRHVIMVTRPPQLPSHSNRKIVGVDWTIAIWEASTERTTVTVAYCGASRYVTAALYGYFQGFKPPLQVGGRRKAVAYVLKTERWPRDHTIARPSSNQERPGPASACSGASKDVAEDGVRMRPSCELPSKSHEKTPGARRKPPPRSSVAARLEAKEEDTPNSPRADATARPSAGPIYRLLVACDGGAHTQFSIRRADRVARSWHIASNFGGLYPYIVPRLLVPGASRFARGQGRNMSTMIARGVAQ
ncbi:hypothetical protein BD779DRAFT_1471127 [Infundibulicybe gibba]|nr:hypothetical protein BD779DRAFT_1471127 [Infundibulicybe gibba]